MHGFRGDPTPIPGPRKIQTSYLTSYKNVTVNIDLGPPVTRIIH